MPGPSRRLPKNFALTSTKRSLPCGPSRHQGAFFALDHQALRARAHSAPRPRKLLGLGPPATVLALRRRLHQPTISLRLRRRRAGRRGRSHRPPLQTFAPGSSAAPSPFPHVRRAFARIARDRWPTEFPNRDHPSHQLAANCFLCFPIRGAPSSVL